MTTRTMTANNKLLYVFALVWLLAVSGLAWLLAAGQVSFKDDGMWIAFLILIPCNVVLMNLIRNPIREDLADQKTAIGKLFGLIALVVVLFVLLLGVLGNFLALTFPVIAVVILLLQKESLNKREWMYAFILALIAGIAGLGAEWITFITPFQWGLLQVPLALFSFLAGWSILRRTGLLKQGVGQSRFLAEGRLPALRSFLLGILLGTPWALASVVMGSVESSRATGVQSWWQPLVALEPGIAEEAWGRLLFVPLAFLLFRRVSSNRTAFSIALVVMSYLFALVHTSGGGVTMLVSTLIIGTLYILPISVVCLYRDLETAIGFHFWIDFLKYAVALVLFAG